MKPSIQMRLARLVGHDTSLARFITALGLILLGMGMAAGLGKGQAGYALMEQAWALEVWGLIYLLVGSIGIYGSVCRVNHWVRLTHILTCMFLWAFIGIAQFADQPLPTRLLLALPAIVETWVLIKLAVTGPRSSEK